MECHDVYLITKDLHPGLFAAFELISHDCGRQAGHTNYAVPLEWVERIEKIDGVDDQLVRVQKAAPTDFELLCIGDEADMERITAAYQLTPDVNELLQRFFEEFS